MSTVIASSQTLKPKTQTLTQQYAAKIAKDIVPATIKAIDHAKHGSRLVLLIAIVATYGHQATYLLTQGFGWLAWVVPGAFDVGIIVMVIVTQTPAMDPEAKAKGRKALVMLVAVSMGINTAAPGTITAHVVFPLLVAEIGVIEWVSGSIRPYFEALEAREAEVTAAVAPTTNPHRSEAAQRAAATRKANLATEAAKKADRTEARRLARMEREMRTEFETSLAPVSPGHSPVEWRADSTYM